MGLKQKKSSAGTKAGSFKVNNPVGKASSATKADATNPFPGRKNSDTAASSGLRGRLSIDAYAAGRSYGK